MIKIEVGQKNEKKVDVGKNTGENWHKYYFYDKKRNF